MVCNSLQFNNMPETTLITGASGGIGMELARVFAREGHDLFITARREDRLNNLKIELETNYKIEVHVLAVDLSEREAPQALFKYAEKNNLTVNILVNNAGVGDYGLFHQANWKRQETMIDLNMKSLAYLTHLFLPKMIGLDSAYIMNVASNAAFQPGPTMSIYYATKHFVLAFSEAIADELRYSGVSVTALCPGPTKSEFRKRAGMNDSFLYKHFPVPDSREVAEYGYKSMMKGKRIAVHGMVNKFFSVVVRLLPRRLVTTAVRTIITH